jgi:hypothetical protein
MEFLNNFYRIHRKTQAKNKGEWNMDYVENTIE